MYKIILILFMFLGTAVFAAANITDTEITRRVREQIMRDSDLSRYARNVKVVTIDGQVLIRGIVIDNEELDRVLGKAQSVAGVLEIVNEMEPINE